MMQLVTSVHISSHNKSPLYVEEIDVWKFVSFVTSIVQDARLGGDGQK
jgi:hypothetical protein